MSSPPGPTSIEETGLPAELLVQLLVKRLFSAGELTEATAGEQLKLPYAVMKELFGLLQRDKLCEVRGHGEPLGVLYRYHLTDAGRARAQACRPVHRQESVGRNPYAGERADVRTFPYCPDGLTILAYVRHARVTAKRGRALR